MKFWLRSSALFLFLALCGCRTAQRPPLPEAPRAALVGPPAPFVLSWPTNTGLVTISQSTDLLHWQTVGTSTSNSFTVSPVGPFAFFRGSISTNRDVTLTWDASISPDVAGYRIYYGVASRSYSNTVDAGLAATCTISNLVAGREFFFAATAYNFLRFESEFSNEVSYTPPPRAPFPLSIRQQ